MNEPRECKTALEYIRKAKAELPLAAKFEEGEVDFPYQTARNCLILAEAHIRQCLDDWTALREADALAAQEKDHEPREHRSDTAL